MEEGIAAEGVELCCALSGAAPSTTAPSTRTIKQHHFRPLRFILTFTPLRLV